MTTTTPTENDVLFGRGSTINSHPGNTRFRALVDARRAAFQVAKKRKEKRTIALEIIHEVNSLRPSGRFLESTDLQPTAEHANHSNPLMRKGWVCAQNHKVIDKIFHRLRETPTDHSENFTCDQQEDLAHDPLNDEEKPIEGAPISQTQKIDDNGDGEESDAWDSFIQQHLSTDKIRGNGSRMKELTHEKILGEGGHGIQYLSQTISEGEQTLISSDEKSEVLSHNDIFAGMPSAVASSLDGELDSFLRDFGAQHDDHQLQLVRRAGGHEVTLRQWIDRKSESETIPAPYTQSMGETSKHVKSALSIALKLAEYLADAQNDEGNVSTNPVPLASIAVANVLLQMRDTSSGDCSGSQNEAIASIKIRHSSNHDPETGGELQRLAALGVVLYELFSGEEPVALPPSSNLISVDSITLDNCKSSGHRPQKSRQLSYSKDESKLASVGIPYSLCTLVKNLLDCFSGDFCEEEAYGSFSDVIVDLRSMLDDPSRFLDNIKTNTLPALVVCDKLYGREDETKSLENSYQRHTNGECNGVLIGGGAGVGKSKLATHLFGKSNGHFLSAKFDQNQDGNQLFTIRKAINSLCDLSFQDATADQLNAVEEELVDVLGSQTGLLASVIPNLEKLMPSCSLIATSRNCINSMLSMRYLFSELLRVLSSNSRPITLLLDDIQWADSSSLMLTQKMLSCKLVFFVICYRNDEVDASGHFTTWLSSISSFFLDELKLLNMSSDGVNSLISDALHLCPSRTRPLSSVLYHKSHGNPLFLGRLINSLQKSNHIYFQMKPPRWGWDLDRIATLEISDDVLALLMKEMQNLPSHFQLGLKIASCMGTGTKYTILGVLSKDQGLNLCDVLCSVSKSGFMVNHGTMFTFAHDRIQEAAYESMTQQQRCENHMRIGLALCAHSMENSSENYELFFLAINQINHGGPNALHDSSQKNIIAALNLKGARRAIELSDLNEAFKLFQHGISFLGEKHWEHQYDLSIDLFQGAAEVACVLNESSGVTFHSEQVITNARCFEDKLSSLYAATKLLMQAQLYGESMKSAFEILLHCGDEPLCPSEDNNVRSRMKRMNEILRTTSNQDILNMNETTNKKIITMLKLYDTVVILLHYTMPSLLAAGSLRMLELTMENGLTPISPIAFASYGEILATDGNLTDACRLGHLALKLLEKESLSAHKSTVIMFSYQTTLWASEPFQLIVDAHRLGQRAGQELGDYWYSFHNKHIAIVTSLSTGQNLHIIREQAREFVLEILAQNPLAFVGNMILLHSTTVALSEGLHTLDEIRKEGFPSVSELIVDEKLKGNLSFISFKKVQTLVRNFLLFQKIENDTIDISASIAEGKEMLRTTMLMPIFFEGLACFRLARQSHDNKRAQYINQGESVLARMRDYSEYSRWNFDNKKLLLEAERMFTLSDFNGAGPTYLRSIKSAREHRFIHEEAIASELAGVCSYERGDCQNSHLLFMHSIDCYQKWGAMAVAERVEGFVTRHLGDSKHIGTINDLLCHLANGSLKKRQEREH